MAVSDKETPKILSAIMKINQEDGETLSEMIMENGGSLNRDYSKIEAWSTFESE